MKRTLYILLGILLLALIGNLLFVSTNQEDKVQGLSEAAIKEIERREADYRQKKLNECREKALSQASHDVDSILLEQALFIGADTNYRPSRPMRPDPETFVSNIEAIPIKPFLNKRDFVSPFQKKDTFVVDSLILVDSLRLNKI